MLRSKNKILICKYIVLVIDVASMKNSGNGTSPTFITFHVTLSLRMACYPNEIWTELIQIPSFSVSCPLNGRLQFVHIFSKANTLSTSCQNIAYFSFIRDIPAWTI